MLWVVAVCWGCCYRVGCLATLFDAFDSLEKIWEKTCDAMIVAKWLLGLKRCWVSLWTFSHLSKCTSSPWQQSFCDDVLRWNFADAHPWDELIVLAARRRMSVKSVLINICRLIQSPRRPSRFLGNYRVRLRTEMCDYRIHSSIRLYSVKCQGRRSWLPRSLIKQQEMFHCVMMSTSPLTSSYLHLHRRVFTPPPHTH